MAQGQLTINTEKLLPIIKKWLYSDKDIFIRELVSNGCDAISKLKFLSKEENFALDTASLRIDISIDKENKTITIQDTGLGMTAEEVEKYIAQLAFSGAEAFAEKYSSEKEGDKMIGHFGLGFYSAYMVSKKVTIDTLSYLPGAKAAKWECDGSHLYDLSEGTRAERGTSITLHIDDESVEYLEESKLSSLLQKYCQFLPFPIYLGSHQINATEPLWVKSPSECKEQDYIDFYQKLYPFEPDPVFWVHINVDSPFTVRGILYFAKENRKFDWKRSYLNLFCNRVFVSDDCKEIIPEFLMSIRGAIDSPDIPLNVSRSYLQMDKTVRGLSTHISKKVADRLSALFRTEREKFLSVWDDIEAVVKLGILGDGKFYEKAKEFLVWKNLAGEFQTVEEYLAKGNTNNKVYYTIDGKHQSHVLDLYKEKGIDVLLANGYTDAAVMNFLEEKMENISFQRIDGSVDALEDKERASEKSEDLAATLAKTLNLAHVKIEAKSLLKNECPAILVLDERMRRMRDYMALTGTELPVSMTNQHTLVVNTNNKLIERIGKLSETDPNLASELIHQVYDLTRLSQKELLPSEVAEFIARSGRLLEKVTENQTSPL